MMLDVVVGPCIGRWQGIHFSRLRLQHHPEAETHGPQDSRFAHGADGDGFGGAGFQGERAV